MVSHALINHLMTTVVNSPVDMTWVVILLVVGFVAAVGIGSLAWYNSKRPTGWEDKDRPDFVPNIDKKENPGLGS